MKQTKWERLFKCPVCGKSHRVNAIRRDLDKAQEARIIKCRG